MASPPINQKKATRPAALTPNFAHKTSPPKTIREFGGFERESPILLASPGDKPHSAQKKIIIIIKKQNKKNPPNFLSYLSGSVDVCVP